MIRQLLESLRNVKEHHPDASIIKIYYSDENNYTIKFINNKGEKYHTVKKMADRKFSGTDCKWREKNEQHFDRK